VRIWDLRDNLSSYDAASIALAESLDDPARWRAVAREQD
jgi:predicted nucleic acid-binding protein